MNTVPKNCELIILTTFDSSLFDRENKSYQIAVSTIKKLQNEKIPLVTVTAKTQAEIADVQTAFGLNEPSIVEYGSAILIPQNCDRFKVTENTLEEKYYVKQLGCTHIEARAALKVIQSTLRINNLRGFGDLSETEIQSLTGLSAKQVKQTKTREFSEIFVTPKSVNPQETIATAKEFGFKVLIEDNLSYLIGAEANVKKAIQWLKDNYQLSESTNKVVTVGLGNTSEDLEMLEVVDIPIVIAGKNTNSDWQTKKWNMSKAIGLKGWVETIEQIYQKFKVL